MYNAQCIMYNEEKNLIFNKPFCILHVLTKRHHAFCVSKSDLKKERQLKVNKPNIQELFLNRY